jgi:hypothetical protein
MGTGTALVSQRRKKKEESLLLGPISDEVPRVASLAVEGDWWADSALFSVFNFSLDRVTV